VVPPRAPPLPHPILDRHVVVPVEELPPHRPFLAPRCPSVGACRPGCRDLGRRSTHRGM